MAFQGSLAELPLPDIIQLVSVSGKTGVFELRRGELVGRLYLRDGQIEHAVAGAQDGEEALYELATWEDGDFVFSQGLEPPTRTIGKTNTNLLMEAARRIDEWKILSKRIPSPQQVPVLRGSEITTSISLSAAEWRLISKIDGQRSLELIGLISGQSTFDAAKILYGLLTSGLVILRPDVCRLVRKSLQEYSPEQLLTMMTNVHSVARQLLADDAARSRIDRAARAIQNDTTGREMESLLELVRNHEQSLLTLGGLEPARAFIDALPRLTEAPT